jgi:hypothetical protein
MWLKKSAISIKPIWFPAARKSCETALCIVYSTQRRAVLEAVREDVSG